MSAAFGHANEEKDNGDRKMKKLLCCSLMAVAASATLLGAGRAPYHATRPINVFNLDSTHFTGSEFGDDKMNAEGLREYVHRILGHGAFTHFFICPGAQVTLCDTKTMSPSWWFRASTPA